MNGDLYKLEHLNEEQFRIAYVILKKIKEWLSLYSATHEKKKMIQAVTDDGNGMRWNRKKCFD